MQVSDRVLGPGIVLAGGLLLTAALRIPAVPGAPFGPGLMPGLLGAALVLLGARIGLAAFMAGRGRLLDASEWRGNARGVLCAIWSLLGLVAVGLCFDGLGFPICSFIYAFGLMLLMRARLPVAAVSAVLLVGFLDYGFGQLLGVPLPDGPLPLPW